MPVGEFGRDGNIKVYEFIASPVPIRFCDPETSCSEYLVRWRPRWNGNQGLSLNGGNSDFASKAKKGEGHVNLNGDVITVSFENLVLFDMNHYVEITRRSGSIALSALSPQFQSRTGVHARRHLNREFLLCFCGAFPFAGFAGILDDEAFAITILTRPVDGEESVAVPDLSSARAGLADGRLVTRLYPCPFAGGTLFLLGDLNLLLNPEDGFLKFDLQIIAKIFALSFPLSLTTEEIAKKVIEDIIEVSPEPKIEDAPRVIGRAKPLISLPFVLIAQNFIGLVDLLEFFLRTLIMRVPVRMILQGEFSVGFLNLFVTCITVDVEYLMVILTHCNTLCY